MKFPFVLRSQYEKLEDDAECRIWCLNRQMEQMEKERKGLIKRIRVGEGYRAGMEQRIKDLLEDNRILFEGRARARDQLAAAEHKIGELSLMVKSMEARWSHRGEKQGEAEKA